MANTTSPASQNQSVHHYVRTAFSSFFGFIAVALIIVSILVIWLNQTLTNTDQYTKTVAPLVAQPDVQSFVVTRASDTLLESKDAPVRDVAEQLLGYEQTIDKTDEQLKVEITPTVEESFRSVVASPAFEKLWKENNQQIHGQLISQLKSNSSTINLDFYPLISGVIDQLSTTELDFIKDKLELPADAGKVTLEGKQLDNFRSVYDYFNKATFIIVICTIIALTLCVWISVHHLKTLRRVALASGVFAAILAILLSATSLITVSGTDAEQQKFALALVDGITHDLRIALIVVAVICIGGAIASKVYTVWKSRQTTTTKHS